MTHQAATTQCKNFRIAGRQLRQRFIEIIADFAYPLKKSWVGNLFEYRLCDSGHKWSASEGRTMIARVNRISNLLAHEDGTNR